MREILQCRDPRDMVAAAATDVSPVKTPDSRFDTLNVREDR